MAYKDPEKQREWHKDWYSKHQEEQRIRSRLYHKNRRIEILNYYGKGKIECECCKERTLEFLSIDHIDGGGTEQKRKLGTRDIYSILSKIKKETGKYPPGYRILCHNCNQAIGFYGKCPHMLQ